MNEFIRKDDYYHCNIDQNGEPWDMFVSVDANEHYTTVSLHRGDDGFVFYKPSQLRNAIVAMKVALRMMQVNEAGIDTNLTDDERHASVVAAMEATDD